MKKTLLIIATLASAFSAIYLSRGNEHATIDNSAIQWYTFDEAMAAHEQQPKKVLIDMYTDWCGWCKVMDQKTFTDATVIEYINANFYPVKFNAEKEKSVDFKGRSYGLLKNGRKSLHELAYTLLDQSPSYPAFVILDENLDRQNIIKGYRPAEQFLSMIQ